MSATSTKFEIYVEWDRFGFVARCRTETDDNIVSAHEAGRKVAAESLLKTLVRYSGIERLRLRFVRQGHYIAEAS